MSAVASQSAIAPTAAAALKHRKRTTRRAATRSVSVKASAGTLEKLYLEPIKKIEGTVTLPGSKSMSNRILLLAALAEGKTKVLNLLDSDDIRYMVGALEAARPRDHGGSREQHPRDRRLRRARSP